MAIMHCHYCNKKLAATFFKCTDCGRIVCAHCLGKTGGYKCRDCPHGQRKKI